MKKHNPGNLSNDIIGTQDGWRLLDSDEVFAAVGLPCLKEVERYDISRWVSFSYGDAKDITYRTKLSKDELSELRGFRKQEPDPNFKIWTKENPVSYRVNNYSGDIEYVNFLFLDGDSYYAHAYNKAGMSFPIILDKRGRTKYGAFLINAIPEIYTHKPQIDWERLLPVCVAMDNNGVWYIYYGALLSYSEQTGCWRTNSKFTKMIDPPQYSGHARDFLIMFPGLKENLSKGG